MAISMSDLLERVKALERDQINHLATINHHETVIEHLWDVVFQSGVLDDPVKFAQHYLNHPIEVRAFPGADPVYLDVLHQVYEERANAFRKLLLQRAAKAQARKTSG